MTQRIQLTHDQYAIIDDEDYDLISQFRYRAQPAHKNKTVFYAVRHASMHGDIMGPTPPGLEIDHIDRNPLNNTRENLRFVTHKVNMQNCLRSSENNPALQELIKPWAEWLRKTSRLT